MSYYTGFGGRDECGDDEFAEWLRKLKEEFLGTDSRKGFLAELDAKLKISVCNIENYKSVEKAMKVCFNQLVEDLDVILGKRNSASLSRTDTVAVKDKIKNFDKSLNGMKNLIGEEMYDSKLNYFFLKLKAILLGIANCFLHRDLLYSRTISAGDFSAITSGPAYHVTPKYILPDRPQISLFFSEQIYKEIGVLEKDLPRLSSN